MNSCEAVGIHGEKKVTRRSDMLQKIIGTSGYILTSLPVGIAYVVASIFIILAFIPLLVWDVFSDAFLLVKRRDPRILEEWENDI